MFVHASGPECVEIVVGDGLGLVTGFAYALRGEIHYANHGQIRRRDNDDQDLEGECLTLITNAVICWNTVYTQAALAHVRSANDQPDGEDLVARLSPTGHRHVNFLGRYEFSTPTAPTDGSLRPLRI